MATIPNFLQPEEAQYAASNFPQLLRIQGTNFPVSVLAFDAATKETAYFKLKAIQYGSGDLTAIIRWAGDSATSGDVVWSAQIAAITPDTDSQDMTTKSFATANTVTDSHLGTTAKRIMTCAITISNLDSLAPNDTFWLAISREAANGSDTMTGDALFVEACLEYSDT